MRRLPTRRANSAARLAPTSPTAHSTAAHPPALSLPPSPSAPRGRAAIVRAAMGRVRAARLRLLLAVVLFALLAVVLFALLALPAAAVAARPQAPEACQDAGAIDARTAGELLDLARPLAATPFFSIFHTSVDAPCPFWEDDAGMCAMRECAVCDCPANEVPALWRAADSAASAQLRSEEVRGAGDAGGGQRGGGGGGGNGGGGSGGGAAQGVSAHKTPRQARAGFFQAAPSVSQLGCEPAAAGSDTLNDIDRSHSSASNTATNDWAAPSKPDDWIAQDAPDAELLYVDLLKNPERYTGFSGKQAHRIWSAIYDENCMSISSNCKDGACAPGTCKEERVFYRLISGVHTSITMHIAADYLHGTRWGPNLDIFATRVRAHKEYIDNLYMTLAVVMRAVAKAAPSLDPAVFSYATGDETRDLVTQQRVRQLFDHPSLARGCEELVFDESDMFVANSRDRLPEFRGAFRNISMIMDCVGCEKCRLWGKLQFLGLGTALRILFTQNDAGELKRNEVIALINMLHKLLSSVIWVNEFTDQLAAQAKSRVMLGRMIGVVSVLCVCLMLSRTRSSDASTRKQTARNEKSKVGKDTGRHNEVSAAAEAEVATAVASSMRRRRNASAD